MSEIPKGYCQCGCGRLTAISKQNETKRGFIKGEPYRFLPGHNHQGKKGALCAVWKGGKIITKGPRKTCYIRILMPGHLRANQAGYVLEHILIAEKALGKPLPLKAQVHHHNEEGTDNKGGNLVICQDNAYHKLLHKRLRALKACGHVSWKKCKFCNQYDNPNNMYVDKKTGSAHHRSCMNAYAIERRKVNNGTK